MIWQIFPIYFFYICFQSGMDIQMKEFLGSLNEWGLMCVCMPFVKHVFKKFIFGLLERLVQGVWVCVCVWEREREKRREERIRERRKFSKSSKLKALTLFLNSWHSCHHLFLAPISSSQVSLCVKFSGSQAKKQWKQTVSLHHKTWMERSACDFTPYKQRNFLIRPTTHHLALVQLHLAISRHLFSGCGVKAAQGPGAKVPTTLNGFACIDLSLSLALGKQFCLGAMIPFKTINSYEYTIIKLFKEAKKIRFKV